MGCPRVEKKNNKCLDLESKNTSSFIFCPGADREDD